MAAMDKGYHKGALYAMAAERIGHPGTSAERTLDNTQGALDLAAKLGSGVVISSIAVSAARV